MDDKTAWTLEERFWLDGAAFYEERLHPQCAMAFPGLVVLRAEEVLESLKGAPRWDEVKMSDRVAARAEAVLALAYAGQGRRGLEAPCRAYFTSTYCLARNVWRLIQHHQTPADPSAAAEAAMGQAPAHRCGSRLALMKLRRLSMRMSVELPTFTKSMSRVFINS